MIALAITSIFNTEVGKLHQKISDIIKQKWFFTPKMAYPTHQSLTT